MPLNRPHHYGYVVADLEQGIADAVELLGAGPFFVVDAPEPPASELADGRPARFAHASAFGQWGDIALELTQVRSFDPPELAPMAALGIGHVSWVVPDVDEESARLASLGIPLVLRAGGGPVSVRWHDARATLGHFVELHQETEFLVAMFERIRVASVGWDGSEPSRPAPPG